MNLLTLTGIGAAIAATTSPQPWARFTGSPRNLCVQGTFTYDSGGTNATAYIQTSLDNQKTWTDIACLQFTTSTARKAINLSAVTPVTTPVALTDGGMTANTCQDGLLGPWFRVKYVTTGTYGGASSLSIDADSIDIPPNP
jgi:hypothetical protein